jgi:hypothetical protein
MIITCLFELLLHLFVLSLFCIENHLLLQIILKLISLFSMAVSPELLDLVSLLKVGVNCI